jgi:abelson tyrosine-protein kinase 1
VNVLEVFGASSASGEPPWFFISPYCQNGSLVTYLKGLKNGEEFDSLRCMHQAAKGMEYLHRKGVLHGDLEVSDHLYLTDWCSLRRAIDDNRRCLLSDFGQSEMRSETISSHYTSSSYVNCLSDYSDFYIFITSSDGTLRWQAPEMIGGHHNHLTQEMDIHLLR